MLPSAARKDRPRNGEKKHVAREERKEKFYIGILKFPDRSVGDIQAYVQEQDPESHQAGKQIDILCVQDPVNLTSYIVVHNSLPPFFSSI